MLWDRLNNWLYRKALDISNERQLREIRAAVGRSLWRQLPRGMLSYPRLMGEIIVCMLALVVDAMYYDVRSKPIILVIGRFTLVYGLVIGCCLWVFYRAILHEIPRHVRRLGFELCLGCGYNLKGNTTGRCPECGKPYEHAKL